VIAQQSILWFGAIQAASILSIMDLGNCCGQYLPTTPQAGPVAIGACSWGQVDRTYLNRLEHGAFDPRLKFIAKIAAALKVEPAELLKTDGPKTAKRGR
jgi:transcriptional regulator with XRE-family HTH domain